ncbi:MAG: hypothetical protein ACRCYO_19190, partial [Bacteroidia bacterium]
KRYTFFVFGPEWLADALSTITLFPFVNIKMQYGDVIIARNVQVEVDWTTACFGIISFSFTSDFIVRTACCE